MRQKRLSLAVATLIIALPMLEACVPAVVVGGAAVGVMSAYDRRSTGVQADDESTEWKAAQRVPDRFKSSSHLNFTAYNRRLLITGETPSEEAKVLIGEQAKMIEGVKEVFNEVAIAPASALGNRSNDGYITSKLKARLVDSNQLSANHIKVVTENTVAYLMGIVTEREAKIAVEIARRTDGVRKVVNIMEVLPDADVRRLDSISSSSRTPPPVAAPVETR